MSHAHGAEAEAELAEAKAKACASDGERLQRPQQRKGRVSAEIAAYFSAMDVEVLSRRGRLVADLAAPHFVTECNGGAASILKAGASRINSRRIKGICEGAADGAKLARACHDVAQDETRRAYLSIIAAGRRVPLAVQQIQVQPGHLVLEVLLFPTDECHPRLVSDVVFHSIRSRVSSRESSPDSCGSAPARSKEFELHIKMGPCDDEIDSLLGLGTASLTGKAVSSDRTCDIGSLEAGVGEDETCSLSKLGALVKTLVSE